MGYFSLVMIIACAVFYYRVGEEEYDSGLLFAALSVALWMGGAYFFRFGWLASLGVQVGLFFALTIWNMVRNRGGGLGRH